MENYNEKKDSFQKDFPFMPSNLKSSLGFINAPLFWIFEIWTFSTLFRHVLKSFSPSTLPSSQHLWKHRKKNNKTNE